MATKKRSYGDACGIARALDTVGERWALMVVRELLLGPKRFTDLRSGLPHVSPDVLAQRLKDLEASDVVAKRKLPPPAASQVYELTPKGLALEPVLVALGRWGGAEAAPPTPEMGISVDAQMLSLRTLFDPERAGDLKLAVGMELDGQRYFATVAGASLVAERGETSSPDVTITGAQSSLIELIRGMRSIDEMVEDGDLTVEGDRQGLERFIELFPLPAAAAEPALAG
jgi:DNA-binding HxlR family transcriptional regulator